MDMKRFADPEENQAFDIDRAILNACCTYYSEDRQVLAGYDFYYVTLVAVMGIVIANGHIMASASLLARLVNKVLASGFTMKEVDAVISINPGRYRYADFPSDMLSGACRAFLKVLDGSGEDTARYAMMLCALTLAEALCFNDIDDDTALTLAEASAHLLDVAEDSVTMLDVCALVDQYAGYRAPYSG